jgi:hypothetical protein
MFESPANWTHPLSFRLYPFWMWDAAERVFRSDRDDCAPGSAGHQLLETNPLTRSRPRTRLLSDILTTAHPRTVLVISAAKLEVQYVSMQRRITSTTTITSFMVFILYPFAFIL